MLIEGFLLEMTNTHTSAFRVCMEKFNNSRNGESNKLSQTQNSINSLVYAVISLKFADSRAAEWSDKC